MLQILFEYEYVYPLFGELESVARTPGLARAQGDGRHALTRLHTHEPGDVDIIDTIDIV